MRYGIRGVMLLTLVVAVGMAAAYQFYRAYQTDDRHYLFVGMIVLCAGPMAIWLLANLLTSFRR